MGRDGTGQGGTKNPKICPTSDLRPGLSHAWDKAQKEIFALKTSKNYKNITYKIKNLILNQFLQPPATVPLSLSHQLQIDPRRACSIVIDPSSSGSLHPQVVPLSRRSILIDPPAADRDEDEMGFSILRNRFRDIDLGFSIHNDRNTKSGLRRSRRGLWGFVRLWLGLVESGGG